MSILYLNLLSLLSKLYYYSLKYQSLNLGLKQNTLSSFPIMSSSIISRISLSAGSFHSCAIRQNTLYCWGDNQHFQSKLKSAERQRWFATLQAQFVSAGYAHTCANFYFTKLNDQEF